MLDPHFVRSPAGEVRNAPPRAATGSLAINECTRAGGPSLRGHEKKKIDFHETFFILAFARDLPRARRTQIFKGLVPDEVVDVNLTKGAQREADVPAQSTR